VAIQDATKTVPVFCRLYILQLESLYGVGTIIDNVANKAASSIRSRWDGRIIGCWLIVEGASEGAGRAVYGRNVEKQARTNADLAGLWMNMSASAHDGWDWSCNGGRDLEKIG